MVSSRSNQERNGNVTNQRQRTAGFFVGVDVVLFEPVQGGDVCVIELRKKSSLSFEAIQAVLVSCELLRQHFDGDVTKLGLRPHRERT